MTYRLMACLTLGLAIFASSAMAQEEGRGQRGRGGQQGGGQQGGGPGGRAFGGGFGMMRLGTGAGSILSMLTTAEVRKEVGVSDEAFEPVEKLINEYRQKRMNRDASEEERTKATEEYNAKAQDVLDELLAPAKLKRLKGLFAQQNQAGAVTNTVIAKEIGVAENLRAEIEKGLQEQFQKAMDSLRQGGGGGGGARGEGMTKMQEEANKLVDGKLSAEQKKALEELKGEKFTFPPPSFPGGGGGNRPGAGGNGRARGDGN